jgi:SpoVK/Ycf46/Vps4 family AAA+-type ATPase
MTDGTKLMVSSPRSLLPFNSIASDIIPIIPTERDVEAEKRGRVVERRTIFKGQLAQVIPVINMDPENKASLPWDDTVSTYPEARAIGQHVNATIKGAMTDESIAKAYAEYTTLHAALTKDKPQVDGLDKIKKGLNKLEKKLESCIVDPTAIKVSFNDVHLPDATIDAIRSMISLPLLYAEAFKTGVLRTHSTNGALLFGPPGTGKTLVAKAVAHECGARMLAVKASDINSKWLGEAEKK